MNKTIIKTSDLKHGEFYLDPMWVHEPLKKRLPESERAQFETQTRNVTSRKYYQIVRKFFEVRP